MNRYLYLTKRKIVLWDLYYDGVDYYLVVGLHEWKNLAYLNRIGKEEDNHEFDYYSLPENFIFMGNVGGKWFRYKETEKEYLSGYEIGTGGIQLQGRGVVYHYEPLNELFKHYIAIERPSR